MKKTLYINSCVRKDSRTDILARSVLERLGGEAEELRLEAEALVPLDGKTLDKRTALIDKGDFSHHIFTYAKQFASADTIVISAPYWDLSFPSSLKVYFEHINIVGITFEYSNEGIPKSLCKADKLIYVTTSGGPIYGSNMGLDYVKALAEGFYGINDIRYFAAEGLDIVGCDTEAIMKNALDNINRGLSV